MYLVQMYYVSLYVLQAFSCYWAYRRISKLLQYLSLAYLYNWRKLQEISHKNHLYSAERKAALARGLQAVVDRINNIWPYHRNLINDDSL